MPVDRRIWFLNEVVKAMKHAHSDENSEDYENKPMRESRAPWHNTPEMRAIQGKNTSLAPRTIRLGK